MRKYMIPLVGAAVVVFASSLAMARGATPLSGMEWVPSERTCFGNGWNQLTNNNCFGARKWLWDLPVDYSGNYHNVTFYGRGNGSTYTVTCRAIGTDATGSSGWTYSASRTENTWGVLYSPGSVWVPSGGNLHADCDIPQYGGVSSAHYDP